MSSSENECLTPTAAGRGELADYFAFQQQWNVFSAAASSRTKLNGKDVTVKVPFVKNNSTTCLRAAANVPTENDHAELAAGRAKLADYFAYEQQWNAHVLSTTAASLKDKATRAL